MNKRITASHDNMVNLRTTILRGKGKSQKTIESIYFYKAKPNNILFRGINI